MGPIEIIVIIGVVAIVSLVVGRYVYKRVKHLPTGECACCSSKKNVNRMLKNVKKELDEEKTCCKCSKD